MKLQLFSNQLTEIKLIKVYNETIQLCVWPKLCMCTQILTFYKPDLTIYALCSGMRAGENKELFRY